MKNVNQIKNLFSTKAAELKTAAEQAIANYTKAKTPAYRKLHNKTANEQLRWLRDLHHECRNLAWEFLIKDANFTEVNFKIAGWADTHSYIAAYGGVATNAEAVQIECTPHPKRIGFFIPKSRPHMAIWNREWEGNPMQEWRVGIDHIQNTDHAVFKWLEKAHNEMEKIVFDIIQATI